MANFQKEVFNKLRQKADYGQNEEMILKKAFKFFDADNSGNVNMLEFRKAIERVGIFIPTLEVSHARFNCI